MEFFLENYGLAFIPSFISVMIVMIGILRIYHTKIREDKQPFKKCGIVMLFLFLFIIGFTMLAKIGQVEAAKSIVKGAYIGIIAPIIVYDSILDIKYSELYMYELMPANLFMVGIPIIYNMTLGCTCIAKYNAIMLGIFLVIWFINNVLNNEKKIGTADVDLLASMLLGFSSVIMAVIEKQATHIVIISQMVDIVFTALVLNIVLYLLSVAIYSVVKKSRISKIELNTLKDINDNIEKENAIDEEVRNNKYRALPMFIMPYITIIMLLFSQ